MELDLGGPVWHASASVRTGEPSGALAKTYAYRALEGIGDATLGQWEETSPRAFHLRRRLSLAEQIAAGLTMRDIRGLPEAHERVARLLRAFPAKAVPKLRAIAELEIEGR